MSKKSALFEAEGPLSSLFVRERGETLVFAVGSAASEDYMAKSLAIEEVVQLRKALGEWLDVVHPEHESRSGEAPALPATTDRGLELQLAKQETALASLREAMGELPALIRAGIGEGVAQALRNVAPIMAEHAAAAARPTLGVEQGEQGYLDRTGRWRPPVAIQYGVPGAPAHPGAGFMGQPPPPDQRIEGPSPGFVPPRGGVS